MGGRLLGTVVTSKHHCRGDSFLEQKNKHIKGKKKKKPRLKKQRKHEI